jgi:VIT1/CCC1 family predicted Fe2+/Mn2+ transporter
MNSKPEGVMAIVAAFFILISAMLAPLVSALVSLVALATFGILRLLSKEK